MSEMEGRKKDHLDIVREEDVKSTYNYWDDFHLLHDAVPEIDMDEIDLTVTLFKKKLKAPIIIAAMTGGFSKAKKINKELAEVAEKYQIGMGVGSQRAALEDETQTESYSVIKSYNIPLKIANIGAPQLIEWDNPIERAKTAIEMIDADVLAIHLNFLQECVQVEGERNAKGCLTQIEKICQKVSTPVIAKETGAGISYNVAKKLCDIGISGIDIGGKGGTSFAAIEAYRAEKRGDISQGRLGKTFWDWGIPTPFSLIDVSKACNDKIPIIATGGIRNGLDVAKALALSASAAGLAGMLLKNNSVSHEIDSCIKELKTAMFLTGSPDIDSLKTTEIWM
jgi:isopentenyl-diphosphate delta-isomerase